VVDQLFSRVGASDDLARGRSTFMVEMTETAAILNQAGPRSLVVVDEIGRGTATLDGLAIAWSVLEALHSTVRCRAIFATHFHELSRLVDTLPRLCLHTMAVREWRGQIVFLHEVLAGSAKKSWGVHVARLAGVPVSVVERAGRLLRELERAENTIPEPLPLFDTQKTLPPPCENTLKKRLMEIDPDSLTPRAALDMLYDLRRLAGQDTDTSAAG
jgi:DNA mismatch repair protein MutS